MKANTIALLLNFVIALPAFSQDYEIRLHRPGHVGDKMKMSTIGKMSQEMSMSADGKVVRQSNKEFTVELDSVATALDVSKKGSVTRASLKIGRLIKTEGGQKKELLSSGTVVNASHDGTKTVFQVDGKPVEADLLEALGAVITVSKGDVTDDDLFGTSERKKVGESWAINKERIMQEFNRDQRMSMKDLSGRAMLKEVLSEGGKPVLVVTMEATAKAVPQIPPGLSVKEGTVTFKASGKFPVDVSLDRPEESNEMTFFIRATGKPNPDGPKMEMKMAQKQSVVVKQAPVH